MPGLVTMLRERDDIQGIPLDWGFHRVKVDVTSRSCNEHAPHNVHNRVDIASHGCSG